MLPSRRIALIRARRRNSLRPRLSRAPQFALGSQTQVGRAE